MTTAPRSMAGTSDIGAASTPLLPLPDMRLRIRPADFARMIGVSRQAVSRMIADGRITLLPCGRLEPARATEELLRNSDPARLRARVLKAATRTHADLATEVQKLERQVAGLRVALADCERVWRARSNMVVHVDDLSRLLSDAQNRLVAALGALIRHDRPRLELALQSGAIDRLVDRLLARAIWQPMVPPQWSDEGGAPSSHHAAQGMAHAGR